MAGGTTAQEGIRMTRIRIMCDQTDGTTIKLGTIQSDEEGKQLMEARYGRFDAMKEARHINPYRDGDR